MQHGWCFSLLRFVTLGGVAFSMLSGPAFAGPPFTTDDPEPTDYRHYEIYVASDYARSVNGVSGTLPHVEINYGLLPNVQFTATFPLAGAQQPHEPMHFGYGDTEFEVKARFIQETDTFPQISIAPTIDLPTGNAPLGLGAGLPKLFLPVWIEKGFGRTTVYGGGGFWRNSGPGNRNYSFTGVAVERDLGHGFTIGTELFAQSADTLDGRSSLSFNVGAVKDLDEHHKLLFSFGRSLDGTSSFTGFAGLELYLGPREKAGKAEE